MNLKEFFRFGDQRFNYWSCAKLAHWVHKTFGDTPKPKAATMDEWNEFHKVNYFCHMVDTVLDFIQNFLNYPFDLVDRIRIYFSNRFYYSHTAKTTLEKGKWYDTDTRLIYCMFGLLEQFVENELALMYIMCFPDKVKKSFFHKWIRKSICNAEYGIQYLLEESNDKSYNEVKAPINTEIIFLYKWWKARETRLNPYEVYGKELDAIPMGRKMNKEQRKQFLELHKKIGALEKQYTDQDDEMMGRLIAIRKELWT